MYRKIVGLALCALMLGAAAACSKDEPVAQPATGDVSGQLPKNNGSLPDASSVTDVNVTKPATVTSIDPSLLPAKARLASSTGALSQDEKICIDDTIYETVKADPSAGTDDSKLASVMGHAMVLCAGPTLATSLVSQSKSKIGLTDEQASCVEQKLATDQATASQFFASMTLALSNPMGVLEAFGPLETACNFTLAQ